MGSKENKMKEFRDFIEDCLTRTAYSSLELSLLNRLLKTLPQEKRQDFMQMVYLDKLQLNGFGKSQFSLANIKTYLIFFLKELSKSHAKKAYDNYLKDDISDNLKVIIEENIKINGEGYYIIYALSDYFYERLTHSIKDLIE